MTGMSEAKAAEPYQRSTPAPWSDSTGLLVAGWVMLFVLPIGALIVGIALANKRIGHAVALTFLSCLEMFLGVVILLLLTGH